MGYSERTPAVRNFSAPAPTYDPIFHLVLGRKHRGSGLPGSDPVLLQQTNHCLAALGL